MEWRLLQGSRKDENGSRKHVHIHTDTLASENVAVG